MKLTILILTAVIISVVNAVIYEEEDVYDDTEVEKSAYEIIDEDSVKPKFDLKDAPQLFLKFVSDYNKEYKTEQEYKTRYGNFVRNLEQIIENNKKGYATSNINMFADYDESELAALG